MARVRLLSVVLAGLLGKPATRERAMATVQTSAIKIVGREEGLRLLDLQAQSLLGISAEEFIRRWDAGEYSDDPDRPEVMRVASLLGFVR